MENFSYTMSECFYSLSLLVVCMENIAGYLLYFYKTINTIIFTNHLNINAMKLFRDTASIKFLRVRLASSYTTSWSWKLYCIKNMNGKGCLVTY